MAAGEVKKSASASSNPTPWSAEDNRILEQQGFRNFKKIGYGMYATVHRADRFDVRTGHSNPVAIKFIDLKTKSANYRNKLFPRELEATRTLKHKNIVPVRKIIISKDKMRVWIVMELEKSDLLAELERVTRVDEEQGRVWVKQMMQGLLYMHQKEWAHRDLKVENVLIGFDGRALLSDFGFSRQQASDSLSSTHLGSMQYSAPEVLDQVHSASKGEYNAFSADVWALGAIMFVMFMGFLPVNGETQQEIRARQEKIHHIMEILPSKAKPSPQLYDLIKRMLTIDPNKRITLNEAMHHPWLTGPSSSPSSKPAAKKSPDRASNKSPESKPNRKDSGKTSEAQRTAETPGSTPTELSSKKKTGLRVPGYERSLVEVAVRQTPTAAALPASPDHIEAHAICRTRSRRRKMTRRYAVIAVCLLIAVVILIFVILAVILLPVNL